MRKRMLIGGTVVALLIVGTVAAAYAAAVRAPGQIELSAAEIDFGSIPNTRAVSRVIQVRNTGGGLLEIAGVSTSCGCTSAEIGSRRMAPGEKTDLRVTFDPQAHDGALGEFMRQVYVRSNDAAAPEAVLTVRVTVTAP